MDQPGGLLPMHFGAKYSRYYLNDENFDSIR